jgi:hypothetical protein
MSEFINVFAYYATGSLVNSTVCLLFPWTTATEGA